MIRRTTFFMSFLLPAISMFILYGCGKDDGAGTPGANPSVSEPVKTLTSPEDGLRLELKSVSELDFEWGSAISKDGTPITYEVLFDLVSGDFSQPLYVVSSDNDGASTSLTMSAEDLDYVARKTGALSEEEVELQWTVKSYEGTTASLAAVSHKLTVVRLFEQYDTPVKTLLAPDNNAKVDLTSVQSLVFEWEEAISAENNPISYEILFDLETGDFSQPLYEVSSDDDGAATQTTLLREELDMLADKAGAWPADEVTIKWSVRSCEENETPVLAEVSRNILIVRAAQTYPLQEGEQLFITGEGSEEGQQAKASMDDPNVFEIYTKVESGKPYYFYSEISGTRRKFALRNKDNRFREVSDDEPAGATVTETGLYRIKLNFNTSTFTVETINDVYIRHSHSSYAGYFSYEGRGVWKLENFNVRMTLLNGNLEERYKIIFTIDGEMEHWGRLNTGTGWGGRPSIEQAEYRDMKVTEAGQWKGDQFKFPSLFCDKNNLYEYNTDVILYMTADKNYTHDFVNYREVAYANPVFTSFSLPDPDVIKGDDGYFYLYATEHSKTDANMKNSPIMRSSDLVHWERIGSIFTDATHPQITTQSDAAIWAPTVSKVGDKYLIYYSQPGKNYKHAIGVASADSPAGPFTDHGKLIDSDEQGVDISIDAFLYQEDGRNYLFWGSFRKISVIELTEDGLSIKPGEVRKEVAGGQYEASYVIKRNGFYYLIVSTGNYVKNGTYSLVVGRSENITGPYLNKAGKDMMKVNHELMLEGDGYFTSPGHCSRIITDDQGQDWILYHSYIQPYDYRCLMLDRVYWVDGWPVVNNTKPSPSAYELPAFN